MSPDATCAAIAAAQFGAIARFQALAHLSAQAIRRRVTSGRWYERLPTTYVLDGAPRIRQQDIMCAVLWARSSQRGRRASCASHTTAAFLHGIGRDTRELHLTTPRSLKSVHDSLVVHRIELESVDVVSVGPLPVTTAARTLLDLGAVLGLLEVESCLEEALRRGLVSLPRLRWQLERCGGRGHRGAKALRRLLDDRTKGYIPSESELELRLFRLLRQARLPLPVRQLVIKERGRFIARVDYAYPDRGLLIEVHGWRSHGRKAAWQRDLERGNELTLTGARTLCFTWSDVVRRGRATAATVARALLLFP